MFLIPLNTCIFKWALRKYKSKLNTQNNKLHEQVITFHNSTPQCLTIKSLPHYRFIISSKESNKKVVGFFFVKVNVARLQLWNNTQIIDFPSYVLLNRDKSSLFIIHSWWVFFFNSAYYFCNVYNRVSNKPFLFLVVEDIENYTPDKLER